MTNTCILSGHMNATYEYTNLFRLRGFVKRVLVCNKNAKPRIRTELNLVLDLYESKTHRTMAGTLAEKQFDNMNRVRVLKDTEK